MCKVSVVMPSLNVAQYMNSALSSVVNQTLEDIEIICVDAGSTDGTLDIIRDYMRRDKRIQLIVSDKKSYGYQMNVGIRHAKGKYIGIVETDDYVPKEMYEELYCIAERQQAEIVKADFYRFVNKDNQIERTYNRLDPTDTFYERLINPAKEPEVFRMIMNTWSGIYLRCFLQENGIEHNETPGASYQDNGFWFKTFCCCKRLYFTAKPYYRNRRDNIASSVANPGKVYCMTEEWAHIYEWLKQDDERFKTFIGMYAVRKFHSLLFTYDRIAPQFRESFICHMGEEMKRLFDAGEYSRDAFTAYEWRRAKQIADHPMDYHKMRLQECSYTLTMNLMCHFEHIEPAKKIIDKLNWWTNRIEVVVSWIRYSGAKRTFRRIKWKKRIDLVNREY